MEMNVSARQAIAGTKAQFHTEAIITPKIKAKCEKAVEAFLQKAGWDFDRIEWDTAEARRSSKGNTVIKVTVLDGGHDDALFKISVSKKGAVKVDQLTLFA